MAPLTETLQKYMVPIGIVLALGVVMVYMSRQEGGSLGFFGSGSGGSADEKALGEYAVKKVSSMFEDMGCTVSAKKGLVKCDGKVEATGPKGKPLGKKFSLSDGVKTVINHATNRIAEQAAGGSPPPPPPKGKHRAGAATGRGAGPKYPPLPERHLPEQGPSGFEDSHSGGGGGPQFSDPTVPPPSMSTPGDGPGAFDMSMLAEFDDYNPDEENAKYQRQVAD